jgi:hypothetical protein
MCLRRWIWMVLLMLPLAAASARGAVVFTYAFDQSSFTATPGEVISVAVYIVETVTAPDSSVLEDQDGLSSAGVSIARTGSVPTDPARIMQVSGNAAVFNDTILGPIYSGPLPEAAGVFQLVGFDQTSGAKGAVIGPGQRRILLATFDIQAGAVVGEITRFQARDFDPTTDDTVTWPSSSGSSVVLDSQVAPADFTLQVVPIPEPSAALLFVMGIFLSRRPRRGRA